MKQPNSGADRREGSDGSARRTKLKPRKIRDFRGSRPQKSQYPTLGRGFVCRSHGALMRVWSEQIAAAARPGKEVTGNEFRRPGASYALTKPPFRGAAYIYNMYTRPAGDDGTYSPRCRRFRATQKDVLPRRTCCSEASRRSEAPRHSEGLAAQFRPTCGEAVCRSACHCGAFPPRSALALP